MTNTRKIPFGQTINEFAQKKIADAVQLMGKALPCSVIAINNAVVKVKFEISTSLFTLPTVWVPIFESIYVRQPIQIGDLGVVMPIDTYLGGISGLGGGTANLSQRANLSTLSYVPVSNVGWPAVNQNQLTLQGPSGVLTRVMDNSASINMVEGSITLTAGGHTVVISSAGVVIDGIPFGSHVHPYIPGSSGSADTGAPLP